MRNKQNYNLTKNITLYEYMEGTALPAKAHVMAWKVFTSVNELQITMFAPELQKIRDWVNEEFTSDLNEKQISLIITSGFRAKQWEVYRGRTGNSQHTFCAVDFQFGNVSDKLHKEIMLAVYAKYDNEKWMGGLAIKRPTNTAKGFIHLDPRKPEANHVSRGFGARWEY